MSLINPLLKFDTQKQQPPVNNIMVVAKVELWCLGGKYCTQQPTLTIVRRTGLPNSPPQINDSFTKQWIHTVTTTFTKNSRPVKKLIKHPQTPQVYGCDVTWTQHVSARSTKTVKWFNKTNSQTDVQHFTFPSKQHPVTFYKPTQLAATVGLRAK